MAKIRKGKDIDVKVKLIVNNELADMSQVTDLKIFFNKDKDTVNPVMTNVDFTQNPLVFSIKETCQYPTGKYRLTVSWKYNGKQTVSDYIIFELVNHSEQEDLKGCTCPCADVVVLDANMSITMGKDGKDGVGIEKAEIMNEELVLTYTNGQVVNLGKIVRGNVNSANEIQFNLNADNRITVNASDVVAYLKDINSLEERIAQLEEKLG